MSELPCDICSKPVKIESAAVTHDGKAVHEECYVRQIGASRKAHDPAECRERAPKLFPPRDQA